MDIVSALLIGVPAGSVGIAVGAGLAMSTAFAARARGRVSVPDPAGAATPAPEVLGPVAREIGAARLDADLARWSVDALGIGVVVLGPGDEIVLANPAARRLGAVRDGRLGHSALRALSRQARQIGETRETELELPRGRGLEPLGVRVRVAPLGVAGHTAIQVEDVTEAHRLANVRRDFVANVSHELKTPVGALALLAEAVLDATDDPAAVQRFAERMRHEAGRLGRLVQELIELSRLQGADPLPEPRPVSIDRVVTEVVDRTRLPAEAKEITVVSGGERGLVVEGSESQLITAVSNLVENAITYSGERTRVTIGTRQRGHLVEISVSDQGMGVPETDLDRIFERFYRADPARSRATGGTGLGLSIVKHIATNHGGSVDVWSVQGSGSTFTLRLPNPSYEGAPPVEPEQVAPLPVEETPAPGNPSPRTSPRNAPSRQEPPGQTPEAGVVAAGAGAGARAGTGVEVESGAVTGSRPVESENPAAGNGRRPTAVTEER